MIIGHIYRATIHIVKLAYLNKNSTKINCKNNAYLLMLKKYSYLNSFSEMI